MASAVNGMLSNTEDKNPSPNAVRHEAAGNSSTGISEAQLTSASRNTVPLKVSGMTDQSGRRSGVASRMTSKAQPCDDLRSEDRRHVPRLSSGRPRALISSTASSNLKAQHLLRRGCIEAVPKFGRVRPAPTGEGGTAGSAWALD